MATLPLGLRFSLRELLLLILFAGLGLAAMRNGGAASAVLLFLAMLLCIATAIVAFVGAGSPRAYAIGFTIAAATYGGIVAFCGTNELEPGSGVLPTTHALGPVRDAMTTRKYVDLGTGRELTALEYAVASGGTTGSRGGGGFFSGAAVVVTETPSVATLMTVAHALIALLLGYVGGKFAAAVHCRRPPSRDRVASETVRYPRKDDPENDRGASDE